MANLIMICVDSLRCDRLSYFGYPILTTPCLDKHIKSWSKKIAISPSSWTPTVFASILSGLYPWEHRVLKDQKGRIVEGYNVESHALLSCKDYLKICITGNPWISPYFPVSKDFDEILYTKESWQGDAINRTLEEKLSKIANQNQNILLFLHYMDLHEPYGTEFKDRIDMAAFKSLHHNDGIKSKHGWDSLEENIRYVSSIFKVDYYVAQALDILKDSGLLDDSVIAIFSDHGEDLRDHGRIKYPRHGHSLYNELIAVPAIFNVPLPYSIDKIEFLELRSIIYLLYDLATKRIPDVKIYQEDRIYSYVAYEQEVYSLLDTKEHKKYIYNATKGSSELYDLGKDWREKINIMDGQLVKIWHARLSEKVDPERNGLMETAKKYDCDVDLSNKNSPLTKMINLTGSDKKVLEFGCATGYITKILKERGCSVTGIEIDECAAKLAEPYCFRIITGNAEDMDYTKLLGDEKFDVILFGDFLEHLIDPEYLLKKMRGYLKSDGYIVASIPNIGHSAILGDLLKGRFVYRDKGLLDQTHIRFFTKKSIIELFERCGYIVGHIDRVIIPPQHTEIKANLQEFPSEVTKYLLSREEADTYQFVVKTFPATECGRISHLKDHIQWQQEVVDKLQGQLKQTQEQLNKTQEQLNKTQEQLNKMVLKEQRLKETISWKITAPLRILNNIIKIKQWFHNNRT